MYESFSLTNLSTIAAALLAFTAAVIGWWVVHRFTQTREIENARRNLRANYLMAAYRSIENSINRELGDNEKLNLESAVADIQLLGNEEQIEKLLAFVQSWGKPTEETSKKIDLLESLRKELRQLFKLGGTESLEKYVLIRLERNSRESTPEKSSKI